jgi:hypothetical protein
VAASGQPLLPRDKQGNLLRRMPKSAEVSSDLMWRAHRIVVRWGDVDEHERLGIAPQRVLHQLRSIHDKY